MSVNNDCFKLREPECLDVFGDHDWPDTAPSCKHDQKVIYGIDKYQISFNCVHSTSTDSLTKFNTWKNISNYHNQTGWCAFGCGQAACWDRFIESLPPLCCKTAERFGTTGYHVTNLTRGLCEFIALGCLWSIADECCEEGNKRCLVEQNVKQSKGPSPVMLRI